jgi:predicted metal-binding protein
LSFPEARILAVFGVVVKRNAMDNGEHLQALCTNATIYGASKVAPMPAYNVIVDPRVNFKCQAPLCQHYGRSHICPPRVMPAETFAKVLTRYSFAILLQVAQPALEAGPDREKMAQEQVRKLNEVVAKLERDAMYLGYRFAAGLGGGPCPLCEECSAVKGEDCRHPFQARPSMESLGIDVIKTAENAGMPIDLPPKDTYVWTGVLLLD